MKRAINISGTLRLMEVGDSMIVSFKDKPLETMRTLANYCKRTSGRTFSVAADRANNRSIITRIS